MFWNNVNQNFWEVHVSKKYRLLNKFCMPVRKKSILQDDRNRIKSEKGIGIMPNIYLILWVL